VRNPLGKKKNSGKNSGFREGLPAETGKTGGGHQGKDVFLQPMFVCGGGKSWNEKDLLI